MKDALALLRWIENPRDRIAGFRVLQRMPGIGPKTAAVLDLVAGAEDVELALGEARVPPAASRPTWRPAARPRSRRSGACWMWR